MTLDEIRAANAEADKQREAQAQADAMLESLNPPVNSSVVGQVVSKEMTEEEKKQADMEKTIKVRQQLLVDTVKKLVESLVADNDFTVDELGWAQDAFKNLLTIRTTATEQHEEFSKVTQEAQDKFYSFKAKDLIVIPYEVSAGKNPTMAE